MMPSNVTNCIFCGRDTRAKDSICGHCRDGHAAADYRESQGRRGNSRDRVVASELAEMDARSNDDGWAYEDDDPE